ncbi:MAG TPA: GNAT family N-acetyltransferase [Cyclobacteriaceae bacterium]
MQIIKAEEKHFPIIQRIAHATWPATFGSILSPKQIDYMLEMMYSTSALINQTTVKKHVFLLAEENGDYLGYLSYELNYKGLSKTKIHKIYIHPSAQGKGIGKLLIKKAEDIARKNQSAILSLNVNRDNKAVKFYEGQGFVIVGKEDIDIGEGFLMEDYMMDKVLD